MLYYTVIDSPIGAIGLTAEGDSITYVHMGAEDWSPRGTEDACHPALRVGARQLTEYFAGERKQFELPLFAKGTGFQRGAWIELSRIPYGTTISYGEMAKRIGDPKACRAVGAANGKNPHAIIVPCHRVIGANGALVGFGGGLDRKAKLLGFERAILFGDSATDYWSSV